MKTYVRVQWNKEEKNCLSLCRKVLNEENQDKSDVDTCIELLNLIIKLLNYINNENDILFKYKFKLNHLE